MKIYVCVKHVPDTAANIKVVGKAGFDDSVKFVVNPYDEYALEEAVKTAQQTGGEVVVVTVGKESALNSIRSALAVGADRGILVKTTQQYLDSATTSQALKKAIEQDGQPALIFTGKQSVDGEGMQTHYRLAAAFDMPMANDVVSFSIDNGKVTVECEADGGAREVVEMPIPCVIGANKGLNEPRYPKLPDILKAKKKEVKQIDIDDLQVILSDSASELVALEPVPERGQARMLQGSTREKVTELVQRLKDEDKVLEF